VHHHSNQSGRFPRMDRLSALIACAAVVLCACENPDRRPSVATARVDAVTATAVKETSAEAFCDVFHSPDSAPTFRLPKLAAADSEATGESLTTGWRWYNLWATWCKPCVEEIPTLQRWRERFGRDGKPVELVFLSVDPSGEAIAAFRERYPNTPRTLRVEEADSVPPWLGALGLEQDAPIPIHVFVSNGRLRCVRTGALATNHYESVAALLSSR